MTRDSTRVFILTGTCNTVALATGLGYAALASRTEGLLPPIGLVSLWAVVGLVLVWVVVAPVLARRFRPLDATLAAIRSGLAPDPGDLPRARKLALSLPVSMSRRSTMLWIGSAFSFVGVRRLSHSAITDLQSIHIMLVTMLVGSMAGAFVFMVTEAYAQRRILPTLFADCKPSSIPGVTPVSIEFKILILSVVTVVVPVGVLTMASVMGTVEPEVILYLGSAFFLSGVALGALIAGSVTRPVESLARAMSRVAGGDLNARAAVLSIDSVGRLTEGFNEMVEGLKRGAFIQETFGRYVAPAVVEATLRGDVSMGGELRQATVLFSDIRDFTALSERLSPTEVVSMLNSYLNEMVAAVVAHGGTVDKFIGDAVMATFGVPLAAENDPLRAVRAALSMVTRLEAWNTDRTARGEPTFSIGIGINTGEVVVGNIGSEKKMEYTVIGDTVNTASRIEALNKQFGSTLLISSATYALVCEEIDAEALPAVAVKGKAEPLVVYRVLGSKEG